MSIEPKSRGNVVRYESGSTTTTYNNATNDPWISAIITNDGASDITITINSMVMVIKSGETLDEDFVDFTSVTITTNVAYRLWLRS